MTNLNSRLYLLITITILPFIVYTGFLHYHKYVQEQQNSYRELSIISTMIATEHKQVTEGVRQLLIAIATTPSVISGHPGGCNIFLNNLKNNYVRYTNFGVVTKNGEVICAADLEQALANPPSLDLIQETIRSNGFSIGAYYPTKSGNSVINFAYPIDQNSLIYASLSLDWIS
ncbi:MAG: hypothetical protein WAV40_02115, partial [Microgenomates group bacterium]